MNEVLETKAFFDKYFYSQPYEREWIDNVKEQLKQSLTVGKPLRFYWFREKKLGNKRLYYIINEKTKKALLIAYGSKKEQQVTINRILSNREYYFEFIRD